MNKIYVLLIIIVSILVWTPILNQVPMGEGYYYFDRCQNQFLAPPDCPTTIWQYDNLARIIFQIMIPLFGDNIHYYMLAQLFIIILVYLTVYIMLLKITNNNFFALATTIVFLANYTGSFSMMATGNYQRFVQRVPNLIPIFASFYYLTKYYIENNYKPLLISLMLFTFGIYLAHHSVFMLPLFITFIFVKTIYAKISKLSILSSIAILSVFMLLSFLLTKNDHLTPDDGILSFVANTSQLFEKTSLQIANLIVPSEITRYIASHWPKAPLLYPFTIILNIFLIPISIAFLIPFLTKKKMTVQKQLLMSTIVALPLVCFLNLYSYGDGVPHPLKYFGEDRIYFIPSIYSSIIIGYFLSWLWKMKGNTFKILATVLLLATVLYNGYLINRDASVLYENSKKMETFISYVKSVTIDKNVKVAIIGPSHLLWPIYFTNLFYNTNENLVFALDSSKWNETNDKTKFDKMVLIDYVDKKIVEKKINE